MAVSIDRPDEAARLASDLGLTFPLLSDAQMDVIRRYGMKGTGMQMADMGSVVIDREGRVQAKQIDRQFGEDAGAILNAVHLARRKSDRAR